MSARAPQEISLEARCKVNLGLAVTARRGDGYHQVETVMARLALSDTIELRLEAASATAGPTVRLTIDGDDGELPTGGDNLAVRAAHAYLEQWAGLSGVAPAAVPGVSIALLKRVPVAAGLGGGSADAGATLRGLAALLPGGVDLAALAAGLGSDVPFFAADLAGALAKGRGERLTPLDIPAAAVVLAKPPLGVTAGEAYASLLGFTPRLKPERALAALAAGGEPGWKNALQPGVMKNHPVVREVLGLLRAAGLRGCLMSGSGPTCFGVAADAEHAERVAAELRALRPDLEVLTTRFE